MRFYQSLDYVNNIQSSNPFVGDNNNGNISNSSSISISGDSNHENSGSSNSSTVKTFTSNGNHQAQALTKSTVTQLLSHSRNETDNFNFLLNYRNDSVHHNNLTIEALTQALSSTTTAVDNAQPDTIIEAGCGNRNLPEGENSISHSNGNAVEECGGSGGDGFSDLESNINHLITRGNLFKLNFDSAETELELIDRNLSGSIECLASSPDDSFMEDDGMTSPSILLWFP